MLSLPLLSSPPHPQIISVKHTCHLAAASEKIGGLTISNHWPKGLQTSGGSLKNSAIPVQRMAYCPPISWPGTKSSFPLSFRQRVNFISSELHNAICSYPNKFKSVLSCLRDCILRSVYISDYSRNTATAAVHKSKFYIPNGVKYTSMLGI